MSAQFGLGAALSVTTGKVCAPLAEIQPLIEYLLDQPVLTHEIGRALPEAREVLLKYYPSLAATCMPHGLRTEEAVQNWLDLLVQAGLPSKITL